jgi:subtilisin family serine protease
MEKIIKISIGSLVLLILSITAFGGRLFAQEENRAVRTFPLTGVEVVCTKNRNPETGQITGSVKDLQGNPVNLQELEARERAAREAVYGKFDPTLYESLQTAARDERIEVAIWIKGPKVQPFGRKPAADDEQRAAELAEVKARHLQNAQGVISRLQLLGYAGEPDELSPLVFVKLPPEAIHEIAKHPDVVVIYGAIAAQPRIDYATTTERTPFIWQRGNTGSGVKVAVHEGRGVMDGNPYLHNDIHAVTHWDAADKDKNYHPTCVAGVIASTHDTHKGEAYETPEILSANFHYGSPQADITSAMSWAINNGARAINMSWGNCTNGAQDWLSRYVDYIVKSQNVSIVVAVANSSNCGNHHIHSPELAWNCIGVGNFDDQNNADWSDDALSGSSVYINPISDHDDFEKPDIVAVGTDINCTDSEASPWIGPHNGTSFAAPSVTGLAALLYTRHSYTSYWNEAVKATILASAFHNIDGPSIPDYQDDYDDKDGAGAVVKVIADNAAIHNQWITASLEPADFSSDGYIDYSGVIQAQAGDKIRVALCWDSDAASDYSTDVLNADLDLAVLNPSNSQIAHGWSWDNSVEMVEFTASVTGDYTIRVYRYRFDAGTDTYMGVAWAKEIETSTPCFMAPTIQ